MGIKVTDAEIVLLTICGLITGTLAFFKFLEVWRSKQSKVRRPAPSLPLHGRPRRLLLQIAPQLERVGVQSFHQVAIMVSTG